MSSTSASPGLDARYIRVRAQLAGTAAVAPAWRRHRSLLIPALALVAVLVWYFAGVDRLADAGLRTLTSRIPSTTSRSREIIGAWRGIADVIDDDVALPEDDAITPDGTRTALDRFQWMPPHPSRRDAPATGKSSDSLSAVVPPDSAPVDEAGTGAPAHEPRKDGASQAAAPPANLPSPIVRPVAMPAGGEAGATIADPFGAVRIVVPVNPPPAVVNENAAPPAKHAATEPPAPKRSIVPAAAKRTPDRPRTTRRNVPSRRAPGPVDAAPMAWADSVTRRQEAP